jgi:guanylate kinase
MAEGAIFIISGPSGGGKTTLVKKILSNTNDLRFSVSYTTREPREGEVNGDDYIFVTEKEFRAMVERGEFAEYAEVHEHMYGTPKAELERAKASGLDLILDIDVQGAGQIKKKYGLGVYCFVLPSSFDILRERLIERKSENPEEIEERLLDAQKEMEEIENYDYIIINDELDEAVECMASIISSARCRRERVLEKVKKGYKC